MIRAALTAVAPWALAAVVGALVWTWTPLIGPAARYGRLESDRDALDGAADGRLDFSQCQPAALRRKSSKPAAKSSR